MVKLTKKAKKEFIKNKLSSNKTWARRALIEVYNLQYFNEQLFMGSLIKNKMGFTRFDAELLTNMAEFYESNQFFTSQQYKILFKRMPKYWLQILKISDKQHLEKLMQNELQAVSQA